MSHLSDRHDLYFMAAYIRGRLSPRQLPFQEKDLADCTAEELEQICLAGEAAGLRLHYFKRFEELPRVRKVLGFLRGLQPESLLDVGSGRGAFLFPFLRAFPHVPVTSLDLLPERAELLRSVSEGGIRSLHALQGDITLWDAPSASYDVVTLLEVLEHIPNVEAAVRNSLRLAKRYVVLTVPSKPDENPEHIHLLTRNVLTELFQSCGCTHLTFDGVPNHLFMAARISSGANKEAGPR